MLEMILENLLYCAGLVVCTVIIWAAKKYLIPWVREKLGAEQYATLLEKIELFMCAAEEIYGAGHGTDKSEYVVAQIKAAFPNVNEDYVTALIKGLMKPLENEGLLNTKTAE